MKGRILRGLISALCLTAIVFACAGCSAQGVKTTIDGFVCEKLFSENTTVSAQGGAIYGDYLFQFTDTMSDISVYDMKTGDKVFSTALEAVPTYHCNNVNFGVTKMFDGDLFPLLYVSMENINEHKALVYRITKSADRFFFNVVQTITYPEPTAFENYYPNCIIDGENGFLYLTGYTKNDYRESSDNKLKITKFRLPSPTLGDVTLSADDAIKTVTLDSISATQGAVVKDGMIYEVFGFDKKGAFYIIDFERGEIVGAAYLPKFKFKREPESLAIYDGDLICVDVSGGVYKLSF